MSVSRRSFLKTSATAAAVVVAVPRPLLVQLGRTPESVPPITDPRIKALALRAVEAAQQAGASYADARLTHTWRRIFNSGQSVPSEYERLGIGVRALVKGYWGFAASPLWASDEAARLGREAVAQAKVNALGKERVVELGTIPVVHDGHWETPIEEDPFTVPFAEILDLLGAWPLYVGATVPTRISARGGVRSVASCQMWRQMKAFASTEGSYCMQTLYRTGGSFEITYDEKGGRRQHAVPYSLPLAGHGWEYVRTVPYREVVPRLYAELDELVALPFKPVEVGRYDVVFDALSIGKLLDETIGAATGLDRALGYEANAGGTSYLNDPFGMLGSYEVGGPLLTVTGNRSMPGGLATTKWDDEGVVPEAFTLVKDGILTDYQTTRESAAWLREYYEKQGKPVHSHGCANAETALDPTLQHPPNLVLTPGAEERTFDDLVGELDGGLAITRAALRMDFQHLNGLGGPNSQGVCYKIKQGKKVALIQNAAFLFRAPELWKGLLALGGPSSQEMLASVRVKGEPEQTMVSTVSAVPATVKQVTIIDPTRKA